MHPRITMRSVCACGWSLFIGFWASGAAAGQLDFGSEQLVKAGGIDITVSGYSVPSFVDWNNDNLKDLVVGEGGGGYTAGVRVYLNTGTQASPSFQSFSYAQSNSSNLTVPASGCLGAFPRTVYWDADGRKDLLVGQADGLVKLFLNNGTDAAPTFDGGAFLQVGLPGQKINIDVGDRATPSVVDWNNDGRKDLVVGGMDGKVRVFLNEGTDTAPDFRTATLVQAGSTNVFASLYRSSPVAVDLDGDGKKDLLVGDTEGQLLFYSNTGTDQAPGFAGYTYVTANGVQINLAGSARSRPSVCDWTGDGVPDLLVGAGDGKIHLYQGVPEPATFGLLSIGVLLFLRRRTATSAPVVSIPPNRRICCGALAAPRVIPGNVTRGT
jgi:hypothetical protein